MARRAIYAFALCSVLALGGSALLPEAQAARACPQPGCPVIGCPPCSVLVCDPGHCAMHCQLVPDCGA